MKPPGKSVNEMVWLSQCSKRIVHVHVWKLNYQGGGIY